MSVQSCDVHELFRLFTLPATDFFQAHLILDIRDQKEHKKAHVNQAFCVRTSSNGAVLLQYGKTEYHTRWSTDCWMGKTVWVYGDPGLKKDHPVLAFLAKGGCKAVKYLKEGYQGFAEVYDFLCTPSVRANSIKHYPSQILPGLLYLGDWNHATDRERLSELGVKHIVTIHNHPENLEASLPKSTRWLPLTLADVDTADIAPFFNETFQFIEAAREKNQAVLVHCGAGVSRSATLVMQYLMRRFTWSAQKAKEHCVERRPIVCPNDGFWRTLCALEPTLGITTRSDPNATSGFLGVDAPEPRALSHDVVGGKVPITTTAKEDLKRKRPEEEEQEQAKRHQPDGKCIMVTLEVRKPEGLVNEMLIGPLGQHQKVIFGRLPSNDVVLEHNSISRQHAALSTDATGTLLVTDLQSGHGTKVDDAWLRPNIAKALKQGSVIRFGASTRAYHVKAIVKHL